MHNNINIQQPLFFDHNIFVLLKATFVSFIELKTDC
jgi:hypothetical protein